MRPYPGPDPRRQVSHEGGEEPIWSRLGDELFYRNGDQWMFVPVTTEPDFTAETPRLLFDGPYHNVGGRSYAVTPDAQRFLLLKRQEQEAPRRINIVHNWFEELKRLAPITSP